MKKLFPSSLLKRALWIVVAPLLFVQIISGYVFFQNHWDYTTRMFATNIAGDIRSLITLHNDMSPSEKYLKDFASTHYMFELKRVPSLPPQQQLSWYDHFLENSLAQAIGPYPHSFFMDEDHVYIYFKPTNAKVFEVKTTRKRLFSRTTYIYILWVLGSSVLFGGIAFIFMRNQIRPLLYLTQVAEAFGRNETILPLGLKGAKEIRSLSRSIIMMRERIRRRIEEQKLTLMGISHDLRTPLTRMRLQLALMPLSTEVEELTQDVLEMEQMVNGYLAYVKDEKNEPFEQLNFKNLILSACESLGLPLKVEGDPDFLIDLQPLAFRRCLKNLLLNAKAYSTHIHIHYEQRKNKLDLFIDDDGPGVPASQRKKIFDPFVRLDSSRNNKTGGVGLGLSIVLRIIHNHKGAIVLSDSPLGGLRVRIQIPLSQGQ